MLVYAVTEGQRPTYSAAGICTAAAGATDIFYIFGGGTTKLIRVQRIEVAGTQTTGGAVGVLLIKRTTANTPASGLALGLAAHDPAATVAAATAVVTRDNGVATTGSGIVIRRTLLWVPAATAQPITQCWEFGRLNDQALLLRSTADGVAVNLNAATITGGSFVISVQWTEE